MTTATAPVEQRERLAIIWQTITRDVERFAGESNISGVNSKRWLRIDETLGEFAAMLVDEVDDTIRAADLSSEMFTLTLATEDIWQYIETRLLDWAVEIETARSERRKVAAAEEASSHA